MEPIYQETMPIIENPQLMEKLDTLSLDTESSGRMGSEPDSSQSSVGGSSEMSIDTPCSDEELETAEIAQVEAFWSGHKTSVWVCPCLANLYESTNTKDWKFTKTGLPVLLLEPGGTKARPRRRLQMILAERGTGFPLWIDVIDNLSNYRASGPFFHTLCQSQDHTKLAGFSMASSPAARQLFERVERLTSDPANISLSGPLTKQRRRRHKSSPATAPVRPKKADISQPCCFQHVTSVDVADRSHLYSLSTLTLGRSRKAEK